MWRVTPRKRDQIEMRDYMDRRVTPPKRVPRSALRQSIEMTPKFSRKLLACDSWSHLIFKHFDVIFVVCRRVYITLKIVICLKKIYMTFFLFTSLLIMNLRLEPGVSVFPANKQTSFCNE